MKSKFFSLLGLGVFIFVFTCGLFESITNVFVWLITLDLASPTISIIGQIFIKYSTWLITFYIVGVLFKSLGWYNSDAMKIVYFIISTIISFILSWIIMLLEKYLLYIAIILIVFVLTIIVISIIFYKKNKEKTMEKN